MSVFENILHSLAFHRSVNVLFLTLASADLKSKLFAGPFICSFLGIRC